MAKWRACECWTVAAWLVSGIRLGCSDGLSLIYFTMVVLAVDAGDHLPLKNLAYNIDAMRVVSLAATAPKEGR